eukprot:gene27021-34134_t
MASMAMFAAVPHQHQHQHQHRHSHAHAHAHAHHDAHHPHGHHHAHHAHQQQHPHPHHPHHPHEGPVVASSSTLPSEMVAPAEETFEQELERVLIEQTAISQEQAASHTAFSLPALNLKYKGSDMYFEKDFGATLTPKHGPAGATTGASGIPKLPAI